MKWREILPQFIVKQWDNWFDKVQGALVQFTPEYISEKNSLFSPLIAVVAIIATIFLVGVAVGSFFVLFSSLLVVYFLLTKFFGIRLDTGDVFVV